MKNRLRKTFATIAPYLILFSMFILVESCRKRMFDEPPAYGTDPDMTATYTIAELKAMYQGSPVHLPDDMIIDGIVTADDRSGNFYKTIVIQDSTAGISIRVDANSLFNDYPIGRHIYIRCGGLYLGAYANLIQIGAGLDASNPPDTSVTAIPQALMNRYIVKGQWGLTVEPTVVNINALNDTYQNMLIELQGVQFIAADTQETYADNVGMQSLNRTVENCAGDKIIIRTSAYSQFAGHLTPSGKGNLRAIYQVFGTTPQLVIRDENDVLFTGARCQNVKEGFDSAPVGQNIALTGWQNVNVTGSWKWTCGTISNNNYAKMSAFGGSGVYETWLITPEIDLSQLHTFSFRSALGFWTHDGLKVYISTNYDGNTANLTSASWTQLSCTIPTSGATNWSWRSSGDVDLSGYSGTARIAFKYTGNAGASQTTTYEIDDINIR